MIETFHFIRPLWLLALLPIAIAFIFWHQRKWQNQGAWSDVIDKHLLSSLRVGGSSSQPTTLPFWLSLIASVLVIFSLAGPSYQQRLSDVFKPKQTHFIVLDLSLSMNATDIKPSRLKRALYVLEDLLNQPFDAEVSLMVFAGEPYLVTPPTSDTKTILSLINGLDTDVVPKIGSRPDLALEYIDTLINNRAAGVNHILLLTDADVIPAKTFALAKSFNQQSGDVSVISVATQTGAPIPLASGLLKHNGEVVIAKLNESALRKLADQGGGLYQNLHTTPTAIDNYFSFTQQTIGVIHEREQNKQISSWVDEGIWLVLLLIPFALLAFRKGYLFCILMSVWFIPQQKSHASLLQDVWQGLWQTNNQQGYEQFTNKNYQHALDKFEDKDWQASSLYKMGEYVQALEHFSATNQIYNEANTLANLGQFDEAIKKYEQVPEDSPDYQKAQEDLSLIKQFMQQNQAQSGNEEQQNNDNNSAQNQPQNTPSNSPNQPQNQAQNNQPNEPQSNESDQNESEQDDQNNDEQSTQTENETQQQQLDKQHANARSDQDVLDDERKQKVQQTLDKLQTKPYGLLKRKFFIERLHRQQNKSDLYNPNTEQQW